MAAIVAVAADEGIITKTQMFRQQVAFQRKIESARERAEKKVFLPKKSLSISHCAGLAARQHWPWKCEQNAVEVPLFIRLRNAFLDGWFRSHSTGNGSGGKTCNIRRQTT